MEQRYKHLLVPFTVQAMPGNILCNYSVRAHLQYSINLMSFIQIYQLLPDTVVSWLRPASMRV